jgi:hypothetical protein
MDKSELDTHKKTNDPLDVSFLSLRLSVPSSLSLSLSRSLWSAGERKMFRQETINSSSILFEFLTNTSEHIDELPSRFKQRHVDNLYS